MCLNFANWNSCWFECWNLRFWWTKRFLDCDYRCRERPPALMGFSLLGDELRCFLMLKGRLARRFHLRQRRGGLTWHWRGDASARRSWCASWGKVGVLSFSHRHGLGEWCWTYSRKLITISSRCTHISWTQYFRVEIQVLYTFVESSKAAGTWNHQCSDREVSFWLGTCSNGVGLEGASVRGGAAVAQSVPSVSVRIDGWEKRWYNGLPCDGWQCDRLPACSSFEEQEPVELDGAGIAWLCWDLRPFRSGFHVRQRANSTAIATNGGQCKTQHGACALQPWKFSGWKCCWTYSIFGRYVDALSQWTGWGWIFNKFPMVVMGIQAFMLLAQQIQPHTWRHCLRVVVQQGIWWHNFQLWWACFVTGKVQPSGDAWCFWERVIHRTLICCLMGMDLSWPAVSGGFQRCGEVTCHFTWILVAGLGNKNWIWWPHHSHKSPKGSSVCKFQWACGRDWAQSFLWRGCRGREIETYGGSTWGNRAHWDELAWLQGLCMTGDWRKERWLMALLRSAGCAAHDLWLVSTLSGRKDQIHMLQQHRHMSWTFCLWCFCKAWPMFHMEATVPRRQHALGH